MGDKNVVNKQLREGFNISMNYSDVLGSGETLVTGSLVESYDNSTGTEVTGIISSFTYGSSILQAFVESGSQGTYKLSFLAKTDSGSFFEEEVFLNIQEI